MKLFTCAVLLALSSRTTTVDAWGGLGRARGNGLSSGLARRQVAGAPVRLGLLSRNGCISGPRQPLARSALWGGAADGGDKEPNKLLALLKEFALPLTLGVALLAVAGSQAGSIQTNLANIVESAVTKISGMGNLGFLYFAAIYIAAEVLAIPVFPLTASSGYLFGLIPGTATVLISATIAACISFYIGRTLLRGWASKVTNDWPKWKAIDGAIAKNGFKVILLLRLSPLLPFAVSNYLYGITSVDFASFFAATFLGFAPGTIGIVYAGSAGKAFFSEGGSVPWYVFAGAGALILFAGQTLARIAGDAIKAMEDEEQKVAAGAAANGNSTSVPRS